MKLRDKLNALQDAGFIKQMMVTSVYGTMQLEGQGVSRDKINLLYEKVQEERKTSNSKLK